MDVIGVDIITVNQRRQPSFQPLQRQAIRRVNPGSTQNADTHATAPSPGP